MSKKSTTFVYCQSGLSAASREEPLPYAAGLKIIVRRSTASDSFQEARTPHHETTSVFSPFSTIRVLPERSQAGELTAGDRKAVNRTHLFGAQLPPEISLPKWRS
jgi:hypothetical protein